MEWSSYQQEFFKQVKENKRNLMISAVAGSGKTTVLVESLKYIDTNNKNIIFCAFNKSIVKTLSEKLIKNNINIKVSTIHSVGLSIIKDNFGYDIQLNFNKTFDTYKYLCNNATEYEDFFEDVKKTKYFFYFIKNILTKCKLTNVDVTKKDKLVKMMEFYDFDVYKYNINLVQYTLEQLYKLSTNVKEFGIEFDDMLFLPTYLNLSLTNFKYDYILGDEIQDLNNSQMEILKSIGNEKSRYYFISDRNQSINGFAGSDVYSVDKTIKEFNCKELPLSICYRCPKSHIKLAKKKVKEIEFFEKNENGIVENITENELSSKIDSSKENMVICRTNSPLINICLSFIKSGKRAYIKGDDLRKKLLKEIDNTKINNILNLEKHFKNRIVELENDIETVDRDFELKFESVKDSQEIQWLKSQMYYKKRNIYSHIDLCWALVHLCSDSECSSILDLKNKIIFLFKESKDSICCSSIHRAKGLEADNVYLLYPHLLPHPLLCGTLEWQIKQESNVEYVALTRSKCKLTFVLKVDE